MKQYINSIHLRGINPVVPTVYDDGLSYYECVAKLQSKLNELIEQVNVIDIDTVKEELNNLKNYVDTTLNTTTEKVDKQLQDQSTFVKTSLEATTSNLEYYVNAKIEELYERISTDIDLYVINPVTGQYVPIQVALNDIYGGIRVGGLTAQEYDELDLTATNYDELELTATSYDLNGVTI